MKYLIIYTACFSFLFNSESSFYNIEVAKSNEDKISLTSLKSKKVLVTAFNTSNPDYGYLKYLNTLQIENSQLAIIAVPAMDFGGEISDKRLKSIRDSIPTNIIVTKPGYVKKQKGNSQHKLFKWLTSVDENSHFDVDVQTDDPLYLISESGILYAVLHKTVTTEVLVQLLKQPDVKE
jgi:glutathione peroxidase-family protein